MSKFIPSLVNENNESFILLDDVFSHEEVIEYAKDHKHNIKFICGKNTWATEILCKMQEAGYILKFYRVPQYAIGSYLYDNFEVKGYLKI